MKTLYYAIAASVTLAALPTFQASAHPVEPNYFCYMRTAAGRVIDLTARMCGVVQTNPVASNGSLTTGSASPSAGSGTTNPADALNYDSRYRSVRTEVRGGVTRRISGGAGDDLSDSRDRETVTSGIIGDTTPTRGLCSSPDDRAVDGSRCGGRASSARPGGRY